MNSSLLYRRASLEDIPAMLDLWERSTRRSPTDNADALEHAITFEGAIVVVAVADDVIVGTLVGGWDGWRGNVYRLGVDPAQRRRGVAAALVARVEAELRSLGVMRMTSLVFHDEPGAPEFWSNNGYERDETVHRYSRNFTKGD